MVDFSFISARFLGADDADEIFAAPGENDPVHFCIDRAERDKTNLSVVFPVVDPLQYLVGKNFGSGQERDAMFGEVGSGFFFVPLEFQFPASHHLNIIHKCVHAKHSTFPRIPGHEVADFGCRSGIAGK